MFLRINANKDELPDTIKRLTSVFTIDIFIKRMVYSHCSRSIIML